MVNHATSLFNSFVSVANLGYVQTGATTPSNVGSCKPTMLRPFARGEKFDRFQTLRNNTQQHPTTCNRVCKRTQHVTSNNVGSCWSTMLRPFARSLIRPALQPVRRRCTICSHVCVIRVILFLALIKTFQLILHKGLFI